MDISYKKEDLNVMNVADLKQILAARQLKRTGKKAELIYRILTSQSSEEPVITRKSKIGRTELPVKIIESPSETKKETPKLPVYEAQHYSTFLESSRNPDLLLGDIDWDINDYPRTGEEDIPMGTPLKRNSPRLGYIGGRNILEIPRNQLDYVVFDKLVAITVPRLKKDNKGHYYLDYDDEKTFLLKPNEPYGSTLGYVLESIYRQIFSIPNNQKLKDVKEIYGDVDIKYPFFEGLENPTKTSPSYKLVLGE